MESIDQSITVDEHTAEQLARTFKALSDPTRVRIIAALINRELCVHDLAEALDMSHSAISHQLGTLREMRLVRFTKEGRHVYYALDDDHIHSLFRQGWSTSSTRERGSELRITNRTQATSFQYRASKITNQKRR